MDDGLFAGAVAGDRILTGTGDEALVSDAAHASRRCESWEATVLGPLFGQGCQVVHDQAAQRELAMLSALALDPAHLHRLHGARRTLRFRPGHPILDIDGQDLTLTVELPCDAHVQVLLDELIKPETMA
jgi:hypothetical protein